MSSVNVIYLVLMVLSAINGAVLVVALTRKTNHRQSNLLLAGLIVSVCYVQFIATMFTSGLMASYPWLVRSAFPFGLAAPAFLLLYIRSMTNPMFRLNKNELASFVPALCAALWYVLALLMISRESYWDLGASLISERYARMAVVLIFYGAYLVQSYREIGIYERRLRSLFSTFEEIRANWLCNLVHLLTMLWVIALIDAVTGVGGFIFRAIPFAVTLVVLLIGYHGLRKSVIFLNRTDLNWLNEGRANLSVPIAGAVWDDQRARLIQLLEEKKPYLQPQLRLTDLAEQFGVKPGELSELLNRGMGVSFYDLINSWRVDEAKRRLVDPKYAHMNLLGIASDCGFNSKSVFNDVFKKKTGMTPSEYRAANPLIPATT